MNFQHNKTMRYYEWLQAIGGFGFLINILIVNITYSKEVLIVMLICLSLFLIGLFIEND